VWIKDMLIFAYNDCVSFEKPVGLLARQEELVRRFTDVHRDLFCDFPGIMEF
jgi:hypothetical protein